MNHVMDCPLCLGVGYTDATTPCPGLTQEERLALCVVSGMLAAMMLLEVR